MNPEVYNLWIAAEAAGRGFLRKKRCLFGDRGMASLVLANTEHTPTVSETWLSGFSYLHHVAS